jgi:Ca2+-binding EF-hand superfamily protein
LKVQVPTNVSKAMFAEADQDRDGWITYEEYFKMVRKYFF